MRLAILVAYLFDDALRPLVEIHLERIRRHTRVPYTIYGSVGLLDDAGRAMLAGQPDVVSVVAPEAPKRRPTQLEHAHYLEFLRRRAEAEGATHFVTLHLDSFPIRDDWVERILARLGAGDAFAAAMPYTYNACLFWPREWKARWQPDDAEREGAFQEFLDAHPTYDKFDNGVGFVFDAWRRGLGFYALEQTAPLVWGDIVMHLVGSTRLTMQSRTPIYVPAALRLPRRAVRRALHALPLNVREPMLAALRAPFAKADRATRDGSPLDKKEQIRRLIEDPDLFVASALSSPL